MNDDVAWRMSLARRVADAYRFNARLAALTVAGSVGSGLAERWSDLELDCYWRQAPTDRDRRDPIDSVGGDLKEFWEYDPSDQEWSENYCLGALEVTISNFTVDSVGHFLDAVTVEADTDPAKHTRLAAIQRCRPLLGAEFISGWRSRAKQYPDRIADVVVELALTPDVLNGWAAREAGTRSPSGADRRIPRRRPEISADNRRRTPVIAIEHVNAFGVRPPALTNKLALCPVPGSPYRPRNHRKDGARRRPWRAQPACALACIRGRASGADAHVMPPLR